MAELWTLGKIHFKGLYPWPQNLPIRFSSGMKGVKIAIQFDSEWDELPFRTATFIAGDSVLTVEDVADSIEIPEQILKCPCHKVYLSVTGQDVKTDAAAAARAAEICDRMEAIESELITATSETAESLMSEHMALIEELNAMSLAKKRFSTPRLLIGRVLPWPEVSQEVDK